MRKEVGEASRIRLIYARVVGIASATFAKVNLSYIDMSPHFENPITNNLFSNWQQAGIIGAQTGSWLTPLDGKDISLNNVGNDRPNLVGDRQLSNPTILEWFNTSAYAKQAMGRYGNAGSYSIMGPGSFTFDAELYRGFRVREGF